MLIKEFYTNMTKKTNKDAITICTTVKFNHISFDKNLLSQIASIPDEGPSITFGSTSRVIFQGIECHYTFHVRLVGINNRPNFQNSRTIWNSNDLTPKSKAVSILIGTNIASRSKKSLNELSVINIYIMDKMLLIAPFSLASVIIHLYERCG